ncbi:hypothetical protein CC2G_002691 [Coprinopsis cinerea AmutBmut pab1-1]|nr:hypothetical protein CC2G_002691 [Coprinopsis cinerea AmutBmut pab1-1]
MYVFEPRYPARTVSNAPGNICNTVLYPIGQPTPIFCIEGGRIEGGQSFVRLVDVRRPRELTLAILTLLATHWRGRSDAWIAASFIEWDMILSGPAYRFYQCERDMTDPGATSDRVTLIHYFNLVDGRAPADPVYYQPEAYIVEETHSRKRNEVTLKFKDGHAYGVDGEVLVVLRWDRDVRRWILEALEDTVLDGLWEVAITLFIFVMGRFSSSYFVDRRRRTFVHPSVLNRLHAERNRASPRSSAPDS